ncbi:MAG: 1-deoxy-D-xylulose-5-phosphate synthase [Clostridia bacterium]|nr:1-deoxy-D-xylulose-5-phosphate synthase [Clostridia bacterium]
MLNQIKNPKDLKKIEKEKLPELCQEIRTTLIQKISTKGGHLSSNLGIVELTTALHYVFEAPSDKIVFDVSHQTYVHKMLTGRAQAFTDAEHYTDVNGFSNPAESEYDLFTMGHTSTSLSLACGLAKARDLLKQKHHVVAIIGDGSLSGGQAYEGLNNIAEQGGNIVIIVNDNEMSIAENHGGYYQNLAKLRASNGTTNDNLFRALGLDYVYEPNGNDVQAVIKTLQQVKNCTRPTVVHIHTVKGYGYAPASTTPENYHYCAPFDIATGEVKTVNTINYGQITYEYLSQRIAQDAAAFVVSAANPKPIGFTAARRQEAGKQFVDVGIAEEHAVAFIAGAAKGGAHPIFGVQGSFLQRSFDQLHQDLALDNNPATLLVLGGHVHGMGGSTHNGFYDIVQLGNIPNLIYLAPISKQQYLQMLDWAIDQKEHSVAIRVPDRVIDDPIISDKKTFTLSSRIINQGQDVAIIAVGSIFPLAQQIVANLQKHNINATLIDPVCVSALDTEFINKNIIPHHQLIITMEEGALAGGFGQKIASYLGDRDIKVHNFGLTVGLTKDFKPDELLQQNGLTVEKITNYILDNITK